MLHLFCSGAVHAAGTLMRGVAHLLQPVEDAIRLQLLPAITGRAGLTDD